MNYRMKSGDSTTYNLLSMPYIKSWETRYENPIGTIDEAAFDIVSIKRRPDLDDEILTTVYHFGCPMEEIFPLVGGREEKIQKRWHQFTT
jgi:hypothetical protein